MSSIVRVFPRTISYMHSCLLKQRRTFRSSSITGANSRYLNPERVSAFDDMCTLESLLIRVRPLSEPQQYAHAAVGHQVSLSSSAGAMVVHLCTELDMKYLKPMVNTGKLVSVESKIGRSLLGKRIGEIIKIGEREFMIESIALSCNYAESEDSPEQEPDDTPHQWSRASDEN